MLSTCISKNIAFLHDIIPLSEALQLEKRGFLVKMEGAVDYLDHGCSILELKLSKSVKLLAVLWRFYFKVRELFISVHEEISL